MKPQYSSMDTRYSNFLNKVWFLLTEVNSRHLTGLIYRQSKCRSYSVITSCDSSCMKNHHNQKEIKSPESPFWASVKFSIETVDLGALWKCKMGFVYRQTATWYSLKVKDKGHKNLWETAFVRLGKSTTLISHHPSTDTFYPTSIAS